MDTCSDFYAAQTFFRDTMPNSRLVQIAWIRSDTATTPWSQSLSFPVELTLKTFPEGVRIARTPVSEISGIYGTSQHWNAQTLTSGQNIFSAINSKCYDLTAEFDLTNTTATNISFQLANKSIVYNIPGRSIFGKTIGLVNNRLKIRILADWSQVEAFVNDGQLSFTEDFAFTPSSGSVSMTANGNVNLLSADFRNINRIWQNAPAVNFKSSLTGMWTPISGSWSDTSIGKQGYSAGGDVFILNSQTGGDFTYEADVRAMIGPASALVFRANSNATQGYCANVDTVGCVKLWAPGRGELTRYSTPIRGGDTYHLKVVTLGSNIKVYFNYGTTAVINYTDASPVLSGQFGLNVFNGYGVIQNLSVNGGTPSSGVIFYQDINYGGTTSPTIAKGNYSSLPSGVPNDWMSSLKIPSGWTVEVYEHGSFGGAKWTFTVDTPWVGADCNDKMSSIKIY